MIIVDQSGGAVERLEAQVLGEHDRGLGPEDSKQHVGMSENIVYGSKASSYFEWTRQDILPYIPPGSNRICEIGCGTGSTLAAIKKRHKPEFVAGFDIHEPSISIARTKIDVAEVLDVETSPLPDYVANMDVFLCLDVLEHLRDPWSTISALHSRLRVGGCLIASIPNVRHYTVSANLLFAGKWNLTESGLLDRTHIRFFVRKTAIELMTSTGLRITAVVPTFRRRLDKAATVLSGGLLSDLCAVQYVLTALKVQ